MFIIGSRQLPYEQVSSLPYPFGMGNIMFSNLTDSVSAKSSSILTVLPSILGRDRLAATLDLVPLYVLLAISYLSRRSSISESSTLLPRSYSHHLENLTLISSLSITRYLLNL